MTLARLLARAGELGKAGLMCGECDSSPALKRRLGCLRPPVIDFHDGEREWSQPDFEQWCEDNEAEPTAEMASNWFYEWANYHNISAYLPGEFWACCPRSYAEFAPIATIATAEHLAEAALDLFHGVPADWILGGAQPTSRAKKIIRMSLRLLKDMQTRAENADA